MTLPHTRRESNFKSSLLWCYLHGPSAYSLSLAVYNFLSVEISENASTNDSDKVEDYLLQEAKTGHQIHKLTFQQITGFTLKDPL